MPILPRHLPVPRACAKQAARTAPTCLQLALGDQSWANKYSDASQINSFKWGPTLRARARRARAAAQSSRFPVRMQGVPVWGSVFLSTPSLS